MPQNHIPLLLEKASRSLDVSFKRYDPCSDSDNKDPKERNVSLYVAHAMLCDQFAVFGEADFSQAEKGKIDVLGISRLPHRHARTTARSDLSILTARKQLPNCIS
jgi:hypothetical protein